MILASSLVGLSIGLLSSTVSDLTELLLAFFLVGCLDSLVTDQTDAHIPTLSFALFNAFCSNWRANWAIFAISFGCESRRSESILEKCAWSMLNVQCRGESVDIHLLNNMHPCGDVNLRLPACCRWLLLQRMNDARHYLILGIWTVWHQITRSPGSETTHVLHLCLVHCASEERVKIILRML